MDRGWSVNLREWIEREMNAKGWSRRGLSGEADISRGALDNEGDRERVDPIWYPCDEGQIKGNIDSDIYHTPDGLSYAFTFKNVICFDTPTAAIDAGFRAAER